MHKRLPADWTDAEPPLHVPGHAVVWNGGRLLLDCAEAEDGRLWFGQCVEGWVIYRAVLRQQDGGWAPAPMIHSGPDALRWNECEGHCDGQTGERRQPSKAHLRAAKVDEHLEAINAQLARIALAPVPGVRSNGRALYPCAETVEAGELAEVRSARGRPRGHSPSDLGVLPRSERVREQRDRERELETTTTDPFESYIRRVANRAQLTIEAARHRLAK